MSLIAYPKPVGPTPFVCDDAGRTTSRRPRQKLDCGVRAVALAFGVPYDDAYDALAAAGRATHRRTSKDVWQTFLTARAERLSFPALKGQKRLTPGGFCVMHPRGRYVVQVSHHVFAVLDGVVHDDSPVREVACVYAAWQMFPTSTLTPGA